MNRFTKTVILFTGMFLTYGLPSYVHAQSFPDSVVQMLTTLIPMVKDTQLSAQLQANVDLYKKTTDQQTAFRALVSSETLLMKVPEARKQLVPLARSIMQQADALKLTDSTAIAAYVNLAMLYEEKGEYKDALPLEQHVLEIRKKKHGDLHADVGTSLSAVADLLESMGEYSKALPLYKQALDTRKKVLGELHPDYVNSLNTMAFIYKRIGEYDKAMEHYLQALETGRKIMKPLDTDLANILNNLASLYKTMGWFEKALPLYQEALHIRTEVFGPENFSVANSINNLAALYESMGEFEKALPLYLQSTALRKKLLGENHPNYAVSLHNLAGLYQNAGKYEKALPLHQQASDIIKKSLGEEHPIYTLGLNHLAVLQVRIGDYEKAIPLVEKALSIRKKVAGEDDEYIRFLNNLALIHEKSGAYEKAIPIYTQALEITNRKFGSAHPNSAGILNNLGVAYERSGDLKKAESYYLSSLDIQKKISGITHPDYASRLNSLAALYTATGDYRKAISLFNEALLITKQTLGEDHPDHLRSLAGLALAEYESGNSLQAVNRIAHTNKLEIAHINRIYSSLSEQEKLTFLNKQALQFSYLPSLLLREQRRNPLIEDQLCQHEMLLKGMVLDDQQQVLRTIRKANDTASMRLYNAWRANKSQIGKQLLLPLASRSSSLDSLINITNRMEQQLSRSAAVFSLMQEVQRVGAKDLASQLKKGEAAVQFAHFRYHNKKWTDSTMYAALVVTSGADHAQFIPLFEERVIIRLLQEGDAGLTETSRGVISGKRKIAATDSIYTLTWKPLEAHLQNIRTVYYSPSGLLHRVPFHALRVDSSKLLMDKYRLNQVLSMRSVFDSSRYLKPASAAVWGSIDYSVALSDHPVDSLAVYASNTASAFDLYTADTRSLRGGEWTMLPGSLIETETVSSLLRDAGISTMRYTSSGASEEAFRKLDGKSPSVIHFATHGFFLPFHVKETKRLNELTGSVNTFTVQENPMFRSGLVLAGGNHAWKGGTTRDGKEDGILTAYEISQMDLSGTDLVVLSACETALGDLNNNEGVIGLQRAFKLAGVKQMIMSLWKVPDKETMELMQHFYRLLAKGSAPREALRNAQLHMRKKYADPYYWAAFVLIE